MNILTKCPGCERLLAPEPDGTVVCVRCASPSWSDRIESFLRRNLLGSFLVALSPLVGSVAGIALWLLLWNDSVGWGLKNATGSVLMGVAMEATVAIAAALVLRRLLPFGKPNIQIAVWSVALAGIPGLLAVARAAIGLYA